MPFKNFFFKTSLFFIFCLNNTFAVAQNSESIKEQITTLIDDYFALERENIYVHFDKTVYFTEESIWFKGYVYNKKINLPFYDTTNIQVQVFDESGTLMETQLVNAISGVFSGKIELNPKYKSGYYYIQFYTNWMNNFSEDESFVQRVKIKDITDNTIPLIETFNPSKINLEFYPEGGNLISNVSNIIGVKTSDINGKSIPNCTIELKNQNNETIKTLTTNSYGITKFEFVPDGQNHKAIVSYNNLSAQYELPNSIDDGISLELNNYAFEDKLFVKVKYNKSLLNKMNSNLVYLVIQQNNKSNIIEILLDKDKKSKEFYFSNEALFEGVNSIRIIDSELNEIAQRLIFKEEIKNSKSSLNIANKDSEKISISGNTNWIDACISISVVPENTLCKSEDNIFVSLKINSYLTDKLTIGRDYFDEITRAKKYELDLLFLAQKSNKYKWNNIKNNAPKEVYSFEKGLQIKGVINSSKANLNNCRIQLKDMLSDVISSTEVIEKNEFFFQNTNVTDSLFVYCDLIDKIDRSVKEMNYNLTITNKYKKFNKNYTPKVFIYPENKNDNLFYDINMSLFDKNSILLKNVELKSEKNKLKRETQSGNANLRGFKIGVDISENEDLFTFIQFNGFNIIREDGRTIISGRTMNSLNGSPYSTPFIFLDGRQLIDLEELSTVRMSDIDEIYISSTAIIPSMNNKQGIIKIYRKPLAQVNSNPKLNKKIIYGGFKTQKPFRKADYLSEHTSSFKNFGLIYWFPWVLSDENGNIKFKLNNNHKKAKLVIDGFTWDGKLIFEEKVVTFE